MHQVTFPEGLAAIDGETELPLALDPLLLALPVPLLPLLPPPLLPQPAPMAATQVRIAPALTSRLFTILPPSMHGSPAVGALFSYPLARIAFPVFIRSLSSD
jgi:hypothetical protein